MKKWVLTYGHSCDDFLKKWIARKEEAKPSLMVFSKSNKVLIYKLIMNYVKGFRNVKWGWNGGQTVGFIILKP